MSHHIRDCLEKLTVGSFALKIYESAYGAHEKFGKYSQERLQLLEYRVCKFIILKIPDLQPTTVHFQAGYFNSLVDDRLNE